MSTRYGNCNFRNLEFNTVCGCQEFTAEEDDVDGSGPSASRARKTCLCGHFINFHTKPTEEAPEPKKQVLAESFRSTRLRSGATSPTSIVALSNAKPTPATEHQYEETYTLSKTFEDPPNRYQPHQQGRTITTSFGENGLGISIPPRDTERINGGRTADSSAVTEIIPPFSYFPGRPHPNLLSEPLRGQLGGPLLRSARSSPLLGQQALQGLNFSRGIADDVTNASTVADSPVITGQDKYIELSRMVNGALHVVKGLSQTFLPLHIQEGKRQQNQTTIRENTPLIAFDGREPYDEELQRHSLAAENHLHTLAGFLANRIQIGVMGEEPRNRVEELPQSVPNDSPLRAQPTKLVEAKGSDKASSSDPAVPSSPPATGKEVILAAPELSSDPSNHVVSESFVNRKFNDIREKVDIQEDLCNDVLKFKDATEQEIENLDTSVFTLREKLDELENKFNRMTEDQSFLKRPREDDDEDESGGESRVIDRRRKRRKRRRHDNSTDLRTPSSVEKNYTRSIATGSEVNKLPDGTIKQTLTTTHSFTHSTSTSFTSASSCSTSTKTALIKSLSNQVGILQQRIQTLESVAAPSVDRPWVVQVVMLPQSTWQTWRWAKEGVWVENAPVPRILQQSSRAWKRLSSRGLIKCLEITGGEARDVERAIRKAFGRVLKALHESTEYSEKEERVYEWSPLRKVPEQGILRTLAAEEMSNQFWKVDFLRGTCAEDLGPPMSSPTSSGLPSSDPISILKSSQLVSTRSMHPIQQPIIRPTHRLYITNCWTLGMNNSGWDTTKDNTQTQLSSVPSKKRASSTQPSSVSGTIRRKSRMDNPTSPGSKTGSQLNYRSGWNEIRNLPAENAYLHDNKHEIANVKPRPTEDEAFWYYDVVLDGPADDQSNSGDSSALGPRTPSSKDGIIDLQVPKPGKRSTRRRKADSQKPLIAVSQQSLHESSMSLQPPLLSQPSFTSRVVPALSREGTNISLMLSHDSDSTPKARSFVGTPPPNSSFTNTRVLRSRRPKDSKNPSDDKTPTNSMAEPRPSQSLIRMSSKESDQTGSDKPVRLSRSSTVEDDPPASLLTNPHNSEETNAELMAKYGHDSHTISKYLEPLTPYSGPIEEELRSDSRE